MLWSRPTSSRSSRNLSRTRWRRQKFCSRCTTFLAPCTQTPLNKRIVACEFMTRCCAPAEVCKDCLRKPSGRFAKVLWHKACLQTNHDFKKEGAANQYVPHALGNQEKVQSLLTFYLASIWLMLEMMQPQTDGESCSTHLESRTLVSVEF